MALHRESIDPATGKVILPQGRKVSGANKQDVDDAVKAARLAFKTTWGLNVNGFDRSRLMHKLANVGTAKPCSF